MDSYRDVITVFLSDLGDFMVKGEGETLRGHIDGNGLLHVQIMREEKVANLITISGNFMVEWKVNNE